MKIRPVCPYCGKDELHVLKDLKQSTIDSHEKTLLCHGCNRTCKAWYRVEALTTMEIEPKTTTLWDGETPARRIRRDDAPVPAVQGADAATAD